MTGCEISLRNLLLSGNGSEFPTRIHEAAILRRQSRFRLSNRLCGSGLILCCGSPGEGRQNVAQRGTGAPRMRRLCASWGGGSAGNSSKRAKRHLAAAGRREGRTGRSDIPNLLGRRGDSRGSQRPALSFACHFERSREICFCPARLSGPRVGRGRREGRTRRCEESLLLCVEAATPMGDGQTTFRSMWVSRKTMNKPKPHPPRRSHTAPTLCHPERSEGSLLLHVERSREICFCFARLSGPPRWQRTSRRARGPSDNPIPRAGPNPTFCVSIPIAPKLHMRFRSRPPPLPMLM
jgi:hypothetical protein